MKVFYYTQCYTATMSLIMPNAVKPKGLWLYPMLYSNNAFDYTQCCTAIRSLTIANAIRP